MAVLADYNSGRESYGRSADAFIGGMEQGQSMMARKQAMRLREEQAAQQRVEFQAKLPVLAAAAQADLASANASIQNAALIEQFRAKAANESKQLNEEYLSAIQLPSFEDQARALSAMQPRVAYMETLPEYKGFVTAVNNSTVRAHSSALVDRQLNNKLNQEAMQNATDQEIAKVRAEATARENALRFEHQKERDLLLREGRVETEDARIRTRSANKYNEQVLTDAADARSAVRDAERAIEILDSGIRTGTAANIETSLRRTAVALGVPDKDARVAKKEELDRILGDAVLRRVNQTKGAVSDKEMGLFEQYSASSTKTPEGNKAILNAYKRVQERKLTIAKMVNDLRRRGDSEAAIQNEVNDFMLNNDVFQGTSVGGGAATPSSGLTAEQQARKAELLEKKRLAGQESKPTE